MEQPALLHIPGAKQLLEADAESLEVGRRYCIEEAIQVGVHHHGHIGFSIYYHEISRRRNIREEGGVQFLRANMWLYQNEKHHVDRLLELGYTIEFVSDRDIQIQWGGI